MSCCTLVIRHVIKYEN